MADIRVNEILDEFIEENGKTTECLNVLIRFKTFVDLISELKNNLEPKELQIFEDFHKEVEEVFRRNEMEFTVNRNLIQRKSQLVESSKPPKSDEIRKQLSSDQTLESKKFVANIRSKALKILKKSRNRKKRTKNVLLMNENQRFVWSFIGCGKELKTKDSLREHLQRHSSDPKAHNCHFEGCSYSTNRESKFTHHINIHNDVRPYKCEFCPKEFFHPQGKKRHIDYHHKETDQTFICQMNECYKQFRTERCLKGHQNRNHLEKKFACSQPNCAFKAVNKSTIGKHMYYYHSDERPFVCDFEGCPKSFKNRFQLKLHLRVIGLSGSSSVCPTAAERLSNLNML